MPTWLTSGLVIEHLAWRVRNERNLRRGLRNMALELKGLRLKGSKVTANIERLNAAYDRLNEMAPAHAADVEGLMLQIEQLGEDLTFAATMLGNSVNGSGATETAQEPLKPPPVLQEPEVPPAHPAPQPVPGTFRAEAEQQIAAGHKP